MGHQCDADRGIVLGLIGLAVVFWNGNWKDENG